MRIVHIVINILFMIFGNYNGTCKSFNQSLMPYVHDGIQIFKFTD